MNNFKNKTVYQIYIKSFCDSNGDGIGDINGIRSKLNYIKSLGADYIWVTPFFPSPMFDNGYDVADYCAVNPLFGTMQDCENMIAEADQLGIGCMFDMVFNHTSWDHEWFKKALTGDPEYMNYYIFRDGVNGGPPLDWTCSFGTPAWEYVESLNKWYLHLFDKSQPDLNWENPKVREELKNVIRFWKKKGVKGFRFDVFNLISKPENLEQCGPGAGTRYCKDGPRIHEFIREVVTDTGIESMITVGEMASTTLENCIKYSNPENHELSMCFNFHHLKVDYKDGDKWSLMPPDLIKLRELFQEWQEEMSRRGGWNAVFWCNHDQPRIVSRFGDVKNYWKESAKCLATFTHFLRGTPYVYQGEELGMTNAGFQNIKQYDDVESRNYYQILIQRGLTPEEALQVLGQRSRDNSRTPMQWNSNQNAGFTSGTPWLEIPENYQFINVDSEEQDPESILNYYRKLIKLRKDYKIISDGDIKFININNQNIFAYQRGLDSQKLLIICNFSGENQIINAPDFENQKVERVLICNYPDAYIQFAPDSNHNPITLRPFEAFAAFV